MQLSRKLLLQPQLRFNDSLFTTAGTYNIDLPAGSYFFELCGGGGQGGATGGGGTNGGAGGAGGYGEYTPCVFKITKPCSCTLLVGAGGNEVALENANGGAGGGGSTSGGAGGNAGGYSLLTLNNGVNDGCCFISTYTAWIGPNDEIVYTKMNSDLRSLCYTGGQVTVYASIPENDTTPVVTYVGTTLKRWESITLPQGTFTRYPNSDVYVNGLYAGANGGAGGGGGGGYGANGRYPTAAGGGGGGGYNGITVSEDFLSWQGTPHAGANGGNGGGTYNSGTAGGSGNPKFSALAGGTGGRGSGAWGSAGGVGGGAGGGGGGGGVNNEDPRYNTAGGGGGGAGGDLSSRGGFHGWSGYTLATDGSNANVYPLDVYDNTGTLIAGSNNTTPSWGMGGAGGTSSRAQTNGSDGWAQTKKIG